MMAARLPGGAFCEARGLRDREWRKLRGSRDVIPLLASTAKFTKGLVCKEGTSGRCSLSLCNRSLLSSAIACRTKPFLRPLYSRVRSDYDVSASDVEDSIFEEKEDANDLKVAEAFDSSDITTEESPPQNIKRDLIWLSLPAIAGQALDPLAQLMETAYIGRLGPVELASAGVSISIVNVVSKLFNIPLLSVATSFVAEEFSQTEKESASALRSQGRITNGRPCESGGERKQLTSVSTALFLAVSIGIFEALALFFGSPLLLGMMGISLDSPMYGPARKFLSIRALGAPALVVTLALQGVLRGFKDTKTPVLCLGVGNFAAVFLFPLLIYYCQLGLMGAAISTVVSQYIVSLLMIWYLNKRVILMPPNLGGLKFGVYLKSGGFLLGRTLAVLITMTTATSMAARQGPVSMAAHQICLQVWLAVSLLTDALATSSQALVASSVSKGDFAAVKEITIFVLKFGILVGASLAAALGVSFGSLATLFTNDINVLEVVKTGALFVGASQPFNALAFIFDGLHYGVSDFRYSAYSMMAVGLISSAVLLYAPSIIGLRGVWLGLTVFMGLRMVAGVIRLLSKKGPWWFLHTPSRYEVAAN